MCRANKNDPCGARSINLLQFSKNRHSTSTDLLRNLTSNLHRIEVYSTSCVIYPVRYKSITRNICHEKRLQTDPQKLRQNCFKSRPNMPAMSKSKRWGFQKPVVTIMLLTLYKSYMASCRIRSLTMYAKFQMYLVNVGKNDSVRSISLCMVAKSTRVRFLA